MLLFNRLCFTFILYSSFSWFLYHTEDSPICGSCVMFLTCYNWSYQLSSRKSGDNYYRGRNFKYSNTFHVHAEVLSQVLHILDSADIWGQLYSCQYKNNQLRSQTTLQRAHARMCIGVWGRKFLLWVTQSLHHISSTPSVYKHYLAQTPCPRLFLGRLVRPVNRIMHPRNMEHFSTTSVHRHNFSRQQFHHNSCTPRLSCLRFFTLQVTHPHDNQLDGQGGEKLSGVRGESVTGLDSWACLSPTHNQTQR